MALHRWAFQVAHAKGRAEEFASRILRTEEDEDEDESVLLQLETEESAAALTRRLERIQSQGSAITLPL